MSKSTYKRAVCLSYNSEENVAPEIAVNGQALLADEVVRIARRFSVPVIEDPALATALSRLEESDEIPEDLYEAVAILLTKVQTAIEK